MEENKLPDRGPGYETTDVHIWAVGKFAVALIVVTFANVYWMVVPNFEKAGPRFYLLDLLLPVGMGGIWVAAFVRQLKSRPLLPLHDTRFEGALQHGD